MRRAIGVCCIVLAISFFGIGLYLMFIASHEARNLLDKWQIRSNRDKNIVAENGLPHSGIPASWVYVFPGNKVVYTVSRFEFTQFEVEFAPINIGGNTKQWYKDIEKTVFAGGPSNLLCDYYRGTPLHWQKIGTSRCPDSKPNSRLVFTVVNDNNLIGKLLNFTITTDESADSVSFYVSNPDNSAERLIAAREIGDGSMLNLVILILSFPMFLCGVFFLN